MVQSIAPPHDLGEQRPNAVPQPGDVTTDVLIVGSGPAGSTAALLLATYGIDHLVVSKYANTANTPRAHITNQRTIEVMRDMGIEKETAAVSSPHHLIGETVFATSLVGEEFARVRSWGNHPQRHADYVEASPVLNCDIPQTRLEPLLVRTAMARGSKIRWSTEFIRVEQDEEGVRCLVRDRLTGQVYTIHSQFLIGSDGGRSAIAEQIGLPMAGEMGKSGSINIWCDMDLTEYCENRPSSLYWIFQPGATVGGVGLGNIRMVTPWTEWLCIWGYDINNPPTDMTADDAANIVRNLVGLPDLDVKVHDFSLWTVNEMYATQASKGRVFCVGDAIHRHPPSNGLGSNTSVADSYNLAWKLATVLRGQAGIGLLESFDQERVPVAEQIVKRANASIGDYGAIYEAFGVDDNDTAQSLAAKMDRRAEPGPEGEEVRQKLRDAMELKNYEFNALGVELGQRYTSGAVIPDGKQAPPFDQDPELHYQPTTLPGAHLPHAWLLNTRDPRASRVSTFDLCGKGEFSLLTGVSGDAWVEAAQALSEELGLPINVHKIGPHQLHDDVYGDWAKLREISDSGAILVRPDLFIAFRAQDDSDTDSLGDALRQILALDTPRSPAKHSITTRTHW